MLQNGDGVAVVSLASLSEQWGTTADGWSVACGVAIADLTSERRERSVKGETAGVQPMPDYEVYFLRANNYSLLTAGAWKMALALFDFLRALGKWCNSVSRTACEQGFPFVLKFGQQHRIYF